MMNKFFAKTVKKRSAAITVAVAIVLLAVSIIVSVLCGVKYGAGLQDSKTVTVAVNSFVYNNERETLEETCESVFEANGISSKYVYRSQMNGDNRELAFVFDANTDDAKLAEAKDALKTKLAEESAKDTGALSGAIVNVSSSSEAVKGAIASSRLWRAAIAVAVYAVLAFIYVAIRHGLNNGLVALVAPLVSAILTTSFVLLTRIPVTNATFYAVIVSAFLADVFVMMLMNKISKNAKEDAYADADDATLIKESLTSDWIVWTAVALGVALVLVGAIATAAVRYFAIASFVGLFVATFVGLIFAPACTLVAKTYVKAKAPKNAYVGAKKADQE